MRRSNSLGLPGQDQHIVQINDPYSSLPEKTQQGFEELCEEEWGWGQSKWEGLKFVYLSLPAEAEVLAY